MARSRDTVVPFGRGRRSFRPAPPFGRPRRRRIRPVLDWLRSARAFLILVALVGLLTVLDGLGFGRSYPTRVNWLQGQADGTRTAAVATPVVIDGVPRIIDGDTLDIGGRRVRLHGIDAPESAQRCTDRQGMEYACGRRATAALAEHIGRRPVACEERDVDPYGRIVAVCRMGDEDVNGWMVAQGWAMAYRHYSLAYAPGELGARVARRGLWSGDFAAPWDWRADNGIDRR